MKRSKFTDQQIAFGLRQAEEGTPVAEVCRKVAICDAPFYAWKKSLLHDLRQPIADVDAGRAAELTAITIRRHPFFVAASRVRRTRKQADPASTAAAMLARSP